MNLRILGRVVGDWLRGGFEPISHGQATVAVAASPGCGHDSSLAGDLRPSSSRAPKASVHPFHESGVPTTARCFLNPAVARLW
jgi:hypothetical protein